MIITPQELKKICDSCAASIFRNDPPTDEYAEAVSKLLIITACTESGNLQHSRQTGFDMKSIAGAFSIFQIEHASINESLGMLQADNNFALAKRCAAWWQNQKENDYFPDFWMQFNTLNICNMITGDPRLACLFARLHYLRINRKVPDSIEKICGYWKEWYNSRYGKGTVEKALEHWNWYEHNTA